ncbi:MAG: ATP-binding cassette domain-containing protein [Acidimicrobiia bacterium]
MEDVSLAVPGGRFVALVGPSGCGKSTILNLAAGLLAPSKGSIIVHGQPLKGPNEKAAYLFKLDGLLPWKTVLDNVALGLVFRGWGRRAARDLARDWLGRVGLGPFADHFPRQLSGGMRKRVVGTYPIDLPRPRDLMEVRTEPRFVDLYRTSSLLIKPPALKHDIGMDRSL